MPTTPANPAPPQGGNPPSAGGANPSGSSGNAPTPKGHPRMYDISFLDDDSSNFAFWHFRVQTILKLRGLWGVVDGSEKKPDPAVDATAHADWISKDQEAHVQITLTLKDEPLQRFSYVCGNASRKFVVLLCLFCLMP
ncbi:hypothetical protein H4582DRAFT_1812134 [Lactarius indigo]|nr:hypothetical protein H4582DRAFT_1812134 [Lactarius indigo]